MTTRVAYWAAMAAVLATCTVAPAVHAAPTKVAGGIRFTYADPNAGSVSWAGEFNGWNTTANPMTKDENGIWSIVIALPPGEQQYKFVVDGQYFADPSNPVTAGDFGNSVVNVGPEGDVTVMQATSNTLYSPKIFIGGRSIGLYQAINNPADSRFELRRPNMDIDFNFDIRMSDALQARFLMNINSEAEDLELFRTRLNFDRGHLLFTRPHVEIFAYDNEDAGTWDDPLHLVGDIGIYHHAYGYQRQGFRVRSDLWGFSSEFHYADNFQAGGTAYPSMSSDELQAAVNDLPNQIQLDPSASGFAFLPNQVAQTLRVNRSDNNEDMVAVRLRREVFDQLTLGVLGRSDRGFDLGSGLLAEVTGPQSLRLFAGDFEQEWYAGGGEASWRAPGGFEAFAEYLKGRLQTNGVQASNLIEVQFNADSTTASTTVGPGAGEHRTLDDSERLRIGGRWTEAHGDVVVQADVEHQSHDYKFVQNGLDNAMTIWRLSWQRNWRYYLNRQVVTRLKFEGYNFDYARTTPWNYQMWFPAGNFWLEHDEHLVGFDRLTLLGGDDVLSIKPGITIPLPEIEHWLSRLHLSNAELQVDATINTVQLFQDPRYFESIFRFGVDLTRDLRFATDSRWARYRDPRLGLDDSYLDQFAEFTYRFAPTITVSLGFGVDPWVIDPPVNEYAYIGRDLYLFGLDANAGTAETNYFSLGSRITEAERALRAERRIQVEAIVHF